MPSIRRATRALVVAAALAWSWAGAAAPQTRLDLSLPEARQLAVQATLAGQAELAREVAAALLEADPDDRVALTVLAAVEPRLGRPAEGRRAAGRAWAVSTTRAERHEAARLAARAAAVEGRPLLAEAWLRLALLSATDEQEARTLAEARAIRARSPWRVEVELGFSPSDNVNGGAESPFNVVDGLPFVGVISADGRALSGWVGTADLRFARRLSESRRQRTELSVRVAGRGVVLSEEARDLVKEGGDTGITGSDFASVLVEAGVGHRRPLGWGIAGAELTLGRSRYGDEAPATSLRLSGFAAREIGGRQSLRLSAQAEERRDSEGNDQQRLGAELAWGLRVRESDSLTLAVSRAATLSDNGNRASEG